ncbi:hypothetical protein C8F01DRAFT_1119169 [Mycena amicta]|nr:hypothetical protein C8F01DRAFT_1119169 [Mycena amicta]
MTSLRSDISTATPATHSSHIRVMATQIQPTNDTNATLPLPNELLQHIFTLALEPAHETTLPTSTPLAWPVLQVCGHWREIALSLPQLWSTVVVSTGSIDIRHQNLLQLQLERSRNAPLDIVLRMTYKYHWQDSDFDGGLHGILKLLAAVCFRWQSIHISIDVDYRLPASFTAIDTLPVLEEVTFSGGAVSRLDRLGWKLLFRNVPKLHRVVLSEPSCLSMPCGEEDLPWTQIRTYKATYTECEEHRTKLKLMANTVVDADLGLLRGIDSAAGQVQLGLPQLRKLVARSDMILDGLFAPALTDLHVQGTVISVLPFLHSSGCCLSRLTLDRCIANAEDILGVLRAVSGTLEHLALDTDGERYYTVERTRTLLDAFCVSSSNHLCPKLTSLAWSDSVAALDQYHNLFVKMVASRWRVPHGAPAYRLRRLVVYLAGRLRLMLKDLQVERDEGLDVKVVTSSSAGNVATKWRQYLERA